MMNVRFVVYQCVCYVDAGDFPNTSFEKIRCYGENEEAEARAYFEELKQENRASTTGGVCAAITTVEEGKEFRLDGYLNQKYVTTD